MKKSLKSYLCTLIIGTSVLLPFSANASPVNGDNNVTSSTNITQNSDIKPAYMEQGVITGNAVNLRSGPSTSSTILEQLNKGTTVWLVSGPRNGWYCVVYYSPQGAIQGYVYESYVSF